MERRIANIEKLFLSPRLETNLAGSTPWYYKTGQWLSILSNSYENTIMVDGLYFDLITGSHVGLRERTKSQYRKELNVDDNYEEVLESNFRNLFKNIDCYKLNKLGFGYWKYRRLDFNLGLSAIENIGINIFNPSVCQYLLEGTLLFDIEEI